MKTSRKTPAKTAILELITHSTIALSHQEIQKSLQDLCDRVTIYRVLDRLVEEGHIHKVVNTDGVLKFAGCHNCTTAHQHNHIHFSCLNCKAVTCLEDVEPTFQLPQNYQVQEMNFTLSGLCPQCK